MLGYGAGIFFGRLAYVNCSAHFLHQTYGKWIGNNSVHPRNACAHPRVKCSEGVKEYINDWKAKQPNRMSSHSHIEIVTRVIMQNLLIFCHLFQSMRLGQTKL